MYLKKIVLNGFKSFNKKTEILVSSGLTAIVGPNGSGKSNIVDAIRWVIGEQSIKSLRASSMKDVIFSGTKSVNPSGKASVSLIFDNTDNIIDLEYNEVSITRTMFKSGENQYFINGSKCRLIDIREILNKSGIGISGYTVISQGEISKIIDGGAEHRKIVFEEVSGILEHKNKKQQANKKLENVEKNLYRVSDLLNSMYDEYNELEEKSLIAREYLELKEKSKKYNVHMLLEDNEKNKIKYKELLNKKEEIEKEIFDLNIKKNDYKKEFHVYQEKNNAHLDNVQKIYLKRDEVSEKIGEMKLNKATLLQDIKNIELKNEKNLQQIEKISVKINELIDNKKLLEQDIENLSSSKIDNENIITEKEHLLTSMQQELNIHKKKLEEDNQSRLLNMTKIEFLNNEIKFINDNLKSKQEKLTEYKLQKQTSSKKELIFKEKATSLQAKLEEQKNNLDKFDKLYQENLSEKEKIHSKISNYEDEYKIYEMKIQSINQKIDVVDYQINSLENKNIVYKELHNTNLSGIIGVINQLLRTDKEYTLAIETALGGAQNNIVVNKKNDAKDAILYLKKNKLGRATFLPLDGLNVYNNSNQNIIAKGFLGKAKDLIDYDQGIETAIEFLLGNTLVFDNIENATYAFNKLNKFRIVTLQGDVINRNGVMSGGFNKNNSKGLLTLNAERDNLLDVKDDINNNIDKIKSNVKKIKDEYVNINNKISNEKIEIDKINQSYKLLESEIIKLNHDIKELTDNINMLDINIDSIELEINNNNKKAHDYKIELESLSSNLIIVDENKHDKEEDVEKLRKEITDIMISNNSIISKIDYKNQQLEYIQKEINELNQNNITYNEEIQISNDSLVHNKSILTEIEEKLSNYSIELSSLQDEVSRVQQEHIEYKDKIASFEAKIEDIEKDNELKITELKKLEVRTMKYDIEESSIEEKLWERFEMSISEAQSYIAQFEDISYTKKELSELKNKINEYEDVDVYSIKKFETIKEKYDNIKNQKDDLEESKDSLDILIENINKEMEKILSSTVEELNIHFNETFQKLFSGGNAKIVFKDKNDILNTDIDINVQPPGKNLQSISLLSGGEKALTAISLLFSILKYRPSPICILDEIDAALDDENVSRFSTLVKEFSENNQYIVVTHRKGTMEKAKVLYGVSMITHGISSIVSITLEDYMEEI